MTETDDVEYKQSVDLEDARSKLKLIREIVGMANTTGGVIRIGVADDGSEMGVPSATAKGFDPAKIADLLDPFTSPDKLGVEVQRHEIGSDLEVIEIRVNAVPDPPVVMARDGNYKDGSAQKTIFRVGDVMVRNGTKAERATREDFRIWRERLQARVRGELLEQLSLVVEAPPGAKVRILSDDDVRDQPSFLLSQSAALFDARSDRLLSGEDLAYLWKHRELLSFDDSSEELVLQSAMRKRATLFFWIGYLRPDAVRVEQYLRRALAMSDRDKSDAGKSILLLAAIYLDADTYADLASGLAASTYKHFREAADSLPTRSAAIEALDDLLEVNIDETRAKEMSVEDLLETATDLLEATTSPVASKKTNAVGLAYAAEELDPGSRRPWA